MMEGPLAALDAVERATGEPDANVIGYCLGGPLLACTLAYMAAKKDTRVKLATFFTTMLDFEHAGELGVRSEEHPPELQSIMRISYAVFCLKKQTTYTHPITP